MVCSQLFHGGGVSTCKSGLGGRCGRLGAKYIRNLPLGAAVAIPLGLFIKFPVTRLTTSDLSVVERILKIDLVGFFLFAAACIMLLLGLEWGGDTYPWSSARVLGLIIGGVLTFACLARWFVYKGDSALVPPRLSKNRINVAIAVTSFMQSGGVFTASYWLPIWFQGIKNVSPLSSGIMLLPTVISQLITSLVCGALVQRTGYYLPEVVGGNSLVVVGAALMSTMKPNTSEGEWIGYQILVGAGRGFVLQLVCLEPNCQANDRTIANISASWLLPFKRTFRPRMRL